MTRFRLLVLALTLLVVWPAIYTEAELTILGASLSDTGNLFVAMGQDAEPSFSPVPLMPPPDPMLPIPRFPTSPYFGGTASNGPTWIQQFAAALGKPTPLPSLAGGRNYAFIAATTGPQTPSFLQGLPDMQMQVQAYPLGDNPSATPKHVAAEPNSNRGNLEIPLRERFSPPGWSSVVPPASSNKAEPHADETTPAGTRTRGERVYKIIVNGEERYGTAAEMEAFRKEGKDVRYAAEGEGVTFSTTFWRVLKYAGIVVCLPLFLLGGLLKGLLGGRAD